MQLPDRSLFRYEVRAYQLGRWVFRADPDQELLPRFELEARRDESTSEPPEYAEPLVLDPYVTVFSEKGVRCLIGLFIDRAHGAGR